MTSGRPAIFWMRLYRVSVLNVKESDGSKRVCLYSSFTPPPFHGHIGHLANQQQHIYMLLTSLVLVTCINVLCYGRTQPKVGNFENKPSIYHTVGAVEIPMYFDRASV